VGARPVIPSCRENAGIPAQRGTEGVEITGIEPASQLPAVHAILDEAFTDHWGHHGEPFDRSAEQHTGNPSYDPALWLLATSEGQPVGAAASVRHFFAVHLPPSPVTESRG
jgi:hypothetical protein